MNSDVRQPSDPVYSFGSFRVDTVKRLVYDENGNSLPLKAKAFDTLLYLIRNAGRVVERDELLASIWPDTVVEENNLTQHISSLRRLLGEKPDEHRYIATVPGRGYKFVAEVASEGLETTSNPAPAPPGDKPRSVRPVLAVFGILVAVGLVSAYYLWTNDRANAVPRSIAVLPFKPLVETRRDESLEMGMADTIISKLARIDGIVVRPLTAVRRFTAIESDAIEAGRALGVEAVLDGSVQLADDRVRVSAKLLRVADSKQLWAGQFDENLTNMFAVQDSISERVAAALQVRLTQDGRGHPTDNPEAYQLYARGRFHSYKLTPAETEKGIAYFQRAIEIDPQYALAYAGLAEANRSLALAAEYPPTEYFGKALAASRKSLELDDRLAEGHVTYAMISFWHSRDWELAESAFKTGLGIDPNSALGHLFYAHLLSNLGRHDEAVERAARARQIDPVSPFVSTLEGLFLLQAGRYDEAMTQFAKASEIDPQFWMPHMFSARALIEKGRYEDAARSAKRASELSPAQSISIAYESYAAARLGNSDKAKELLGGLEQRSRERYVPPYHLAIAYLGLGDRERALAALEKSVAERDPKAVFLKVERTWDEIRSEPRFMELLRQMRL